MLPQITQLVFEETESATSETIHKTFDWDFNAGDFRLIDGKFIELNGIEYLKLWIQKALRTVKDSFIYKGTDYGSEHTSLIGRSFNQSFAQAEYERMIREALLVNDAITGVDTFSFSQDGARLEIAFYAQSIYGPVREAVTV